MKHAVIPTTNIYFVTNNAILLGRRANTGYMDGKLCPPGGHIELSETPRQAAVREAKEEIGVDIDQDQLEFLAASARKSGDQEIAAYSFIVRDLSKDAPVNTEPGKCSELFWASLSDLPDDIVPDFAETIRQCILGDATYLELGYETEA